jgi:hypothetical protein
MKTEKNLNTLLREIQEACAIATSMNDVNINAVIEEIYTLTETAAILSGSIKSCQSNLTRML